MGPGVNKETDGGDKQPETRQEISVQERECGFGVSVLNEYRRGEEVKAGTRFRGDGQGNWMGACGWGSRGQAETGLEWERGRGREREEEN